MRGDALSKRETTFRGRCVWQLPETWWVQVHRQTVAWLQCVCVSIPLHSVVKGVVATLTSHLMAWYCHGQQNLGAYNAEALS